MEHNINLEELDALIAQEIRNKGLESTLNFKTIKERIMQQLSNSQEQNINELETPAIEDSPREFPSNPTINSTSPSNNINNNTQNAPQQTGGTQTTDIQFKEKGGEPLGQQSEPIVATTELPDFLKNIEHGKVIIFDYNELGDSGENLSKKPLRSFDNPDERISMIQMWSKEGKTKADVYQAKFEKVGELVYDYRNGTTKFIEDVEQPLTNPDGSYKKNPYQVEPNPVIEKQVEEYLTHNVDIDKKVNDVISNIVRDYFLTNNERAINDENSINESHEVISSQKNLTQESYSLNDLVKINSQFKKINTPKGLIEAIENKKDKSLLVYENNEIKKYIYNKKSYYFPAEPLTIKKAYVK